MAGVKSPRTNCIFLGTRLCCLRFEARQNVLGFIDTVATRCGSKDIGMHNRLMDWVQSPWRISRHPARRAALLLWAGSGAWDLLISEWIPEHYSKRLPKVYDVIATISGLLSWELWLVIGSGVVIVFAAIDYRHRASRSKIVVKQERVYIFQSPKLLWFILFITVFIPVCSLTIYYYFWTDLRHADIKEGPSNKTNAAVSRTQSQSKDSIIGTARIRYDPEPTSYISLYEDNLKILSITEVPFSIYKRFLVQCRMLTPITAQFDLKVSYPRFSILGNITYDQLYSVNVLDKHADFIEFTFDLDILLLSSQIIFGYKINELKIDLYRYK